MTWPLRRTVNRVSLFTGNESEAQEAKGLMLTWNKFIAQACFGRRNLGLCHGDIPNRHIEFLNSCGEI